MQGGVARRAFLASLVGGAGGVIASARAGGDRARQASGERERGFDPTVNGFGFPNGCPGGRRCPPAGFDPTVNGFGFPNWGTVKDVKFPDHDHAVVPEDRIRARIEQQWRAPAQSTLGISLPDLPELLIGAIARQTYVSLNQGSATNGHCYGMALAARRYFERPGEIPVAVRSASEISVPVGAYAAVGRDVDFFHNDQFLDFDTWVGWAGVLANARIDYRAQLDSIRETLSTRGTAKVWLSRSIHDVAHQVLAYGYREGDGRAVVSVYDPNFAAPAYDVAAREIEFDTTGDAPAMTAPYRGKYTRMLHNESARVRGAVRECLVGGLLAVFVAADGADLSLAVVDPNGAPVVRDWGPYADREPTRYDRVRYAYDPPAGTHRVRVVAREDADYTLEAVGATADRPVVEDSATRSIAAGETHAFEVDLPASGSGSLRRAASLEDALFETALPAAAFGAAGAAAVAGYRLLGRRRG